MNYYSVKFTSNVQKDYLYLYVPNKICLQNKCVGLCKESMQLMEAEF